MKKRKGKGKRERRGPGKGKEKEKYKWKSKRQRNRKGKGQPPTGAIHWSGVMQRGKYKKLFCHIMSTVLKLERKTEKQQLPFMTRVE